MLFANGSTNNNVGVITEQGDLGLGFNPVPESEKEKINKASNKDANKKEESK